MAEINKEDYMKKSSKDIGYGIFAGGLTGANLGFMIAHLLQGKSFVLNAVGVAFGLASIVAGYYGLKKDLSEEAQEEQKKRLMEQRGKGLKELEGEHCRLDSDGFTLSWRVGHAQAGQEKTNDAAIGALKEQTL